MSKSPAKLAKRRSWEIIEKKGCKSAFAKNEAGKILIKSQLPKIIENLMLK
jgi:hypothetical protein